LKTPARYVHGRVRQVDRGVVGAGTREAFSLTAASATNFEHPQATGSFKAHRRLQTRVHFIPVLVEAPKESEGSARLIREP
jgi:hypothetical protein